MSKKRRSAAETALLKARRLGEALARSPHRMFAPGDLVSRQLTVSDLAAALAPIAPDVAGTVQRIRHWTREGALQPIAFEHGGPGKHRRYNPVAVYKAAVLHVLTTAGLPVSHSQFLADIMRRAEEKAIAWITTLDRGEISKRGPTIVGVTATGAFEVADMNLDDAERFVLTISIDLAKLFAQVDHGHRRLFAQVDHGRP